MKIINTTKGDLGLSEVHIVPALGFIEMTEELLEQAMVSPVVQAWFDEGMLVEDGGTSDARQPVEMTGREAIVAGVIRGLGEDDFTKGGKPEVDAINDVLPKVAEPVTAAERDAVWAKMEDEA
ncbi:hypothetical protein [Leisingera sp. ANG-Vp]|uniref:hypothetical protein n=1 Tax=Leisingera sp. ANG-Vp TaxID=1577896 RepID=UPI00057ED010|nr:hypothetical protein [Leisingera sp. ANG-Vp]KIC22501.1 hypothetical protein RA20_01085 [Leisingera sp. ANG-Vp]